MKADRIKRLERLLERKLSAEEKERLHTIGRVLGIADNDALWDVVSALEYQRAYYEELPQKIAAASTEILQGIAAAAEAEARQAQGRLAESVADLAHKLAVRINLSSLLPMGLCALVCLLVYGSLTMWAGYQIGSGQAQEPVWILRMPAGVLMGGLAVACALFLGVHAAKEFAEGGREWRKKLLITLAAMVAGGVLTGLGA
jgi:hypothetical protein